MWRKRHAKDSAPPPSSYSLSRSRAQFRFFPRPASLASLVVCLTLAVEVNLNKLLKDSGYGRVEIVIKVAWWGIRLTRLNLVTRNLSEFSC